ncbi:phospholipase B1, membrane-associated-like [Ischnura elegans]|uniref:phospholipase B1, membrane-associated-like n=1 Tax=Ischnura elegans TaxID=197161 RepID=UPI001ED8AD91|nr:phospholipase B1, membrane-associated-like [Ischnura elegans]
MKMKLVPALGCLLVAVVGLCEADSSPIPSLEQRLIDFGLKLATVLNGPSLPILTASAYDPSDWWKILQDRIPENTKFPCLYTEDKPVWRSRRSPTSVHQLRPGDIDVVMTLGDSLSAGAAARELTPLGLTVDDRGVSFVGGGEETWRKYTTLPNILKVFNPNLYGYATGKGPYFSESAKLNVAITGAADYDILFQAMYLYNKSVEDPKVNMEEDWKLINILIGQNNICSYQCSHPVQNSPDAHKTRLQEVLDFIQEKFPKTFVNLISVLDTTLAARYPESTACELIRPVTCPCLLVTPDLEDNIVKMSAVVREYQKKEKELASDDRYKNKEDFTVVWQPFLLSTNAPLTRGAPETRVFSKVFTRTLPILTEECVHFNQRGSALVARTLWNNMLEPVGKKTKTLKDIFFQGIKCPTKKNPYLFTEKNSETYRKYCHQ